MKTRNLLLFLVILCCALTPAGAAPIITEFLASNQNGITDETGARPDWIEIFNPDGAPVDLGGYRLTDDAALPAKWVFPAGAVVPAGGYMVVFASGNDLTTIGSPLHTNFSLAAGGEYLAFSDPSGVVLSQWTPNFPAQTPDISYGVISTTPGAASVYFNPPTPGAANNPATAPAEPVVFSLTSRTFNVGQTLNVTLGVTSPTATIRYTIDRSVPTATSPLYTGAPIVVTTSTRIRARAFEPGRPDGPVRSHTYLALDAAAQAFASTIPIVIQHSWNSGHPSATQPTGTTPEDTKLAVMFVFDVKLDGFARMTNLPDVATPSTFERRGSSTFGAAKYNQTVELQTETSEDNAVTVLGMPANGDWVLSAPYEFDRSLMHNDLIYRLSNDAGRQASRTRFVELFQSVADATVNGAVTTGDYFGVYSFQEKISRDENRVDVENLTTADNTVPNVQGGYILKVDRLDNGDAGIPAGGRTFAWVDPREFTPYPTHLAIATAAQKTYIQGYINSTYAALRAADFMSPTTGYRNWLSVNAAVDHHILSIAPKSADAFRLSGYWHKKRFGKLVAGPIWDFDRAMGSTDGRDLNPNTWRGDTGDLGTDPFHDGAPGGVCWYGDMFQDPNFWQLWVDRYDAMRKSPLSTAHVIAVIDEMANTLNPADGANTPAKRNFQKWTTLPPRGAAANTPGTNGTYAGEIAWLKNWWTSRLNFMDGQFSRPATPNIAGGPVAVGTDITLTSPTLATPGAKIYFTTNGTDPRLVATASYTRTTLLSTILQETNPVFAIVPTLALDGTYGTNWRGADLNSNGNNQDDFSHASWFTVAGLSTNGVNGVGYDDALAVNYLPFISLRWNSASTPAPTNPPAVSPNNATSTMRNTNATCYIRLPFTVSAADAAQLVAPNRVFIHARYDDGFVAWINGVEVKRSTQVPAATVPTWNTGIATTHDDNAALAYEDFEITANMNAIHAGENILAVQAMNGGGTPLTSSDLLFQCKMTIQTPPAPYTPGISPQAIEFTGPINVTTPTQLFVRTLHPNTPSDPPTQTGGGVGTVPNGTAWSAPTLLYYFPGASSASPANIQISEVNYHPPSPNPAEVIAGFTNSNDFEFIRITNTGATPVDLTGVYFSSGLTFTAEPGLQNWLPAGASVVVVENLAAFQSRYGSAFTVLGEYTGELDDGGELITLNDKTGAVIASFLYGDSAPWPALADGERSLIYIAGNPALPTSWRASLDPGGSGVSNYATFQQRYFHASTLPPGLQNPTADPDGDGIVNLAEFALALSPTTPDSPNFLNPLMSIRRRPAAGTNLAYTLEYTEDPAAGWLTGGAPDSITPNADGTETAIYSPPNPAATRQLLRMKITSP